MNLFDHREWGVFSIYLDEEGRVDTNKGFWFKIHWLYLLLLILFHVLLFPLTAKSILFKVFFKITLSYVLCCLLLNSKGVGFVDCRDDMVFHSVFRLFFIISGIFFVFLFV
jgi:hypothetical protein